MAHHGAAGTGGVRTEVVMPTLPEASMQGDDPEPAQRFPSQPGHRQAPGAPPIAVQPRGTYSALATNVPRPAGRHVPGMGGDSRTSGTSIQGPGAGRSSVIIQPVRQKTYAEVSPDQMQKAKKYVGELNYEDIKQWDSKQVTAKFLTPIGLGKLAPFFEHHRITGRVLSSMKKDDFKDMKIMSVGDRIYLTDLVRELQLKYRRDVFNAVVWAGTVPAVEGGIAYFPSIWSYFAYKCCPCLSNTSEYEFTRQGLKVKKNPPACIVCCGDTTNKFFDIRFLKDLDWKTEKSCCGFLTKREMIMIFLDEGQSVQHKMDEHGNVTTVAPESIQIPHPSVNQEQINKLLFVWSDARLVAGAV